MNYLDSQFHRAMSQKQCSVENITFLKQLRFELENINNDFLIYDYRLNTQLEKKLALLHVEKRIAHFAKIIKSEIG